ncbi:hypothetical protein GGH95_002040 [Coemansia sp. RSA 1836]|nr:hypothetical protein GGF38_002759 [Coemansia sp. RSA 25]KAJ2503856.1 hypothetical protein IWW47_002803 [Coemansia sp. RSA 2052]KAJ2581510.1 hypothetical protein GGH95_002040 [Coemansia sp. RSA 1836]
MQSGGGLAAQALTAGDRFVEQYYSGFSRSSGKYYQASSKVMWNGNGYSGEQFKATVLPQLQRQLTAFEVTGYDSHTLGGGGGGEGGDSSERTLINVSGLVKIDRKERFAQTFVIERSGTLVYIQSDCFRLV